MLRALPVIIQFCLMVFCLVDCIQTDTTRVRNLPKFGWIVLIVILPLVGSIAWLAAGRPRRDDGPRAVPWPNRTAGFPESERPRPVAPDDDPEFLAGLHGPPAPQAPQTPQSKDPDPDRSDDDPSAPPAATSR